MTPTEQQIERHQVFVNLREHAEHLRAAVRDARGGHPIPDVTFGTVELAVLERAATVMDDAVTSEILHLQQQLDRQREIPLILPPPELDELDYDDSLAARWLIGILAVIGVAALTSAFLVLAVLPIARAVL